MSGPLLVHVVGARPNYMKVAPVHAAILRGGRVEQTIVHTGQHYDRELRDALFDELGLPVPDVQLEVGSGSHAVQTAAALVGLERTFAELEPDLVLVPGDVNSTLAGALAASKLGIRVCHLEAGLRSFDPSMPEEQNRRLTDHLSTLLLTHSEEADANLAAEGFPRERVRRVGNTMIDTLQAQLPRARQLAFRRTLELEPGGFLLVTLHRPALVDDAELLRRTMARLGEIAERMPVVFPVHPRTRARIAADPLVPETAVRLLPPLSYLEFLSLEAEAAAVVTDSGGVQEETTALGVPCFTLRANTERPVTVRSGSNTVLGLDPDALARVPELLSVHRPRTAAPPLWDGAAGTRAASEIERVLGESG